MDKDNRVLLIGGNGFMMNSIKKELESAGLDIIHVNPTVTELKKMEDKPNVYILYIEDLDAMRELVVYLNDIMIEDNISLNVIGSHEEIEKLTAMVDKDKLIGVFERPVNVKELSAFMLRVLETEESRHALKKILVVDDDGTMLRTLNSWLSEKYQVFMVNSGMAAITFLAKKEVDLILLDYEMPVTTGPQVFEMLKSESATQSIPVMFLTNKSDKNSVMQVLNLKPEKYLLKTMSKDELISNIDEFFERQKGKNLLI